MEQLDDSRCVVVSLQNPAKSGQQTLKLWLDINQGFIVRRTITETDGNITSVRNIAYKEDSGSGELVPAHWKYSAFEKNGRLFLDYESLAVELIINRGIDYDPSVQFTPGTLVKDHAVDGPEQIYFVLEDGSRRPVTEDELKRRVTPELLAVTTPGMAGLPGKRSRAVRYIVVAMLAVLCAAIIYRITLSKHIARRLSD